MAWNALKLRRLASRPRLPAGRRIYAIGDIHGRADLLASLFARIDEDLKARPTAEAIQVLLGDYIDRGSSSRQVIEMLIARRLNHKLMLLKGNHEEYALQFLGNPSLLPQWQSIGGRDTVLSYGVAAPRSQDEKSQREVASALLNLVPEKSSSLFAGPRLVVQLRRFLFRPRWRTTWHSLETTIPT